MTNNIKTEETVNGDLSTCAKERTHDSFHNLEATQEDSVGTVTVSNTGNICLPGETPPNPLSKRQLKKRKKLEEYLQQRKARRIQEREKQKQKRQEAIAKGLPGRSGPSRKELKKRQTEVDANSASIHVVVDLDYDDLMSDRDIAKCVKQCLRIYTINRRSEHPGQLYFTGIKHDGNIHNSFKRNDGWENWNVQYHFDKTHADIFEENKIVYLTCESESILNKLEPDMIYVIGALVDHNHQKGLCHARATKAGLKTARLPLSEYVDMKTRSVLSTYHVFELLLRVAGGSSWTDAILSTIPLRKGAVAKRCEPTTKAEDSVMKIIDNEENKNVS